MPLPRGAVGPLLCPLPNGKATCLGDSGLWSCPHREVSPPDPLKPSMGLANRPDGVRGGQHGLGDQDTPRPWGCCSDAQ